MVNNNKHKYFMANQQLTAYIKEEISKGTNNENIKNALLQNGWNSSDIDEAFSVLQAPVSSVPVAPTSNVQTQAPIAVQANNVEVDGTSLNKQMHLHPRAVWLFFLKQLGTWISIGIVISAQLSLVFLNSMNSVLTYVMLILVIFIVMIAIAYFTARLSYHFYKYELAEHEYKAERGIIWKRYVSIPYARIQNVDIYRGLLSRILGLSDLKIQTAGQSAVGSEGNLPALSREHAEIVRDALMVKARTAKGGAGI